MWQAQSYLFLHRVFLTIVAVLMSVLFISRASINTQNQLKFRQKEFNPQVHSVR